ncbi:MAG: anti-sigma factor family protein [Gemmataceae bacterium]
MTCREVAEYLMSYLDGELAEGERVAFEEHLKECPDCVVYLATYREAVRLGREACADEGPAPEDLVRAILGARDRA